MCGFVYVLGSNGKGGPRSYVGWTTDIARRLCAHNAGTGARSTRGRKWVLLYAEKLPGRNASLSREWHLKRDRSFRKNLLFDCAALLIRKPVATFPEEL